MDYGEYQTRVINEKLELDSKLDKLRVFCRSLTFDDLSLAEQWRLTTQAHIMIQYSAILGERINHFGDINSG